MSALVAMIRTEALTALGARARTALESSEMVEAGGTAVKRLLVDHFTELNTERHRAQFGIDGFYADAARSVNAAPLQVAGRSAMISIDKLGLAQRLLGGTIRPVKGEYLAIPARDEAVGKSPRKDFNDQTFVPRRNGQAMLVQTIKTEVDFKAKRRKGASVSDYARTTGGVVMFWLVTEVVQAPDPTVLPDDDLMQQIAYAAMDEFLTRRLASNQPGLN